MYVTIERKAYTISIACFVLLLLVQLQEHLTPSMPSSLIHKALLLFKYLFIVVDLREILLDLLIAICCLPLIKLTQRSLSWLDAIILSSPVAYIYYLSSCKGFDLRFLPPVIIMPLLFYSTFHLVRNVQFSSLTDDTSYHNKTLRLFLAVTLAFSFGVLSLLLCGAKSPFTLKLIYVCYFVGTSLALISVIRPRVYFIVPAIMALTFNIDVLWASWPEIKPIAEQYFRCSIKTAATSGAMSNQAFKPTFMKSHERGLT